MYQVVIGELAHGETVVERHLSHLRSHPELDNNPDLLARALKMVHIPLERVCQSDGQTFEIDFGEEVGLTECVTCQPGDEYVWAVPLQRSYYRRYVLNRQGESCNQVVVVVRWDLGVYELTTAYIGYSPERYPNFWHKHVLIFPGMDQIRPDTLTDVRPVEWNYDAVDYLT